MTNEVTLLFLNAGRRVELIRAFRAAFEELGIPGRIAATDINGLAPALYLGDKQYIMPRSREPGFLEGLARVCEEEKIRLIVPLIDPDLPVLAQNQQLIEATGARVLVSDPQIIEICRDKQKTGSFLRESGVATPEILSLEVAQHHEFPLFIKPRTGSAGLGAYRVDTRSELEFLARYVPDAIIQEFVDGEEITTDVFSDWSGKPIVAIPRKRLKVRAGEVSVARIERNQELEHICLRIAKRLGTVGPINIQAIRSNSSLYVTEINPRFGGGCPLSIAAGVPLPKWVILMALQRPIPSEPISLKNGLTMMRFDDSFFYPSEQVIS